MHSLSVVSVISVGHCYAHAEKSYSSHGKNGKDGNLCSAPCGTFLFFQLFLWDIVMFMRIRVIRPTERTERTEILLHTMRNLSVVSVLSVGHCYAHADKSFLSHGKNGNDGNLCSAACGAFLLFLLFPWDISIRPGGCRGQAGFNEGWPHRASSRRSRPRQYTWCVCLRGSSCTNALAHRF